MARALCGCEKLALPCQPASGDTDLVFNTASLVHLTTPLTIFKENVNHLYELQRKDCKNRTAPVRIIVTGTLQSLRHI